MSVPLIEAIPARFQGPRISHSTNPWATKLRPRPPKISLTPPRFFNQPARVAHRPPPRQARSRARASTREGGRPREPWRSRAVAAMAPATTCPSMPIFHSPARKVKSSPQEQSSSGVQIESTWPNFCQEKREPRARAMAMVAGLMPKVSSSRLTAPRARRPMASNPAPLPRSGAVVQRGKNIGQNH